MDEDRSQGRTRTVTWEDPAAGAAAARTMSGLEYLRAILEGKLPAAPIASLMGFRPVEVEEGRAVFEVTPAEYHYNPIGTVHGGLACTLADSAMGCAVHTTLPAGAGYTTLELKVNLLRRVTVGTGRLVCEGEVIHVGGRIATAEARLTGGMARSGHVLRREVDADDRAPELLRGEDRARPRPARHVDEPRRRPERERAEQPPRQLEAAGMEAVAEQEARRRARVGIRAAGLHGVGREAHGPPPFATVREP